MATSAWQKNSLGVSGFDFISCASGGGSAVGRACLVIDTRIREFTIHKAKRPPTVFSVWESQPLRDNTLIFSNRS